jgi:hypothetical protein
MKRLDPTGRAVLGALGVSFVSGGDAMRSVVGLALMAVALKPP